MRDRRHGDIVGRISDRIGRCDWFDLSFDIFVFFMVLAGGAIAAQMLFNMVR
jgi:hypothetical protein